MRLTRLTLISAALLAPAVIAALGSCGLALDDFEKVPAPVVIDAGPDVDLCKSQTYPPPPTFNDAGPPPEGNITFEVAVRSIDLGEKAPKETPVGLDLDNVCTCLGEAQSCIYPSYATADHCDSPGGVDNAATKLFASIVAAVGESKFGSAFYSAKAEVGLWTLLGRVTGYNGEPNDPKVTFAFYSPNNLVKSEMTPGGMACMGDQGIGAGVVMVPCWNGSDVWDVDDTSVAMAGPGAGTIDAPVYVDNNAYVSDGVLVANVTDADIAFGGGDLNYMSIKLTAGTIMGKIEDLADGLGFRVTKGTLSGRWKTQDVFDRLGFFVASGQSLCTNTPILYANFKSRICQFVDISSKLGGATSECDSISFGMDFTTVPVKFGMVGKTLPPMNHCTSGNDPAMDGCGL